MAGGGRIVLVSGAAGELGRAVVRRFLAGGDAVWAVYRRPEQGDRLRAAVPEEKRARLVLQAGGDWAEDETVRTSVQEVLRAAGRIDVLVNCLGAVRSAPLASMAPEVWHALLHSNLTAVYHALRHVLPVMLDQGFGRIVNVSSWKAVQGEKGLAAFSAAKAAVNRLTEAAAAEVPPEPALDVTVNAVAPATLNTERRRAAFPEQDGSQWVQLEDVAEVIAFLASPGARAINGACIPLYAKVRSLQPAAAPAPPVGRPG